jgi:hypothetical protein
LGVAAVFDWRWNGDERCERADAIRDGGDSRRCGDGCLRAGEEALSSVAPRGLKLTLLVFCAVCFARQVYLCSQSEHGSQKQAQAEPERPARVSQSDGSGAAESAAVESAAAEPTPAEPTPAEPIPAADTPARGPEVAPARAADDLQVKVTAPTKPGADKVLTPPSEPAIPSVNASADAAAIESAILAASSALAPLSERIREARQNPFRDPARAHDCQTIEQVAASCRKAGREWKDPDFGHAEDDLFKNWPAGLDKSAVSWEPPSRYCSTRRPVGKTKAGKRTWLYCDFNGDGVATAAEAMKGSEIEQGLLGDCYLLCALATAVKDLQVADDLIDETYEDAGIYGVSLWVDGRWRMVWVDAYVPCTSRELSLGSDRMMNGRSMQGTGRARAMIRCRPLFAKMKDTKEIWTLLVEKAYAKLKGGYEAIVGGHPGEALALLTGGTAGYTLLANQRLGAQQAMLLPRPTDDFVWLTLSSKLSSGDCFVGAGSVRPSARNQEAQEKFLKGIVPGHAYTVLDAVECATVPHSDEEVDENEAGMKQLI